MSKVKSKKVLLDSKLQTYIRVKYLSSTIQQYSSRTG